MIEPDYALAFSRLTAQNRSRALIVIFSDVIDPRTSRSLIATATRGSARHLLLIVALRNDPLFAAARITSPEGAGDVYRSAAAEEMVTARAEALERMRAGGAMVVDISPAAMSPAVINRYLEIKARGAL